MSSRSTGPRTVSKSRVTIITSHSVGPRYSYRPFAAETVTDGVGSSPSRCELQSAPRRLVPADQGPGARRRRRCERHTRRGRPRLPPDLEYATPQMDRGVAAG